MREWGRKNVKFKCSISWFKTWNLFLWLSLLKIIMSKFAFKFYIYLVCLEATISFSEKRIIKNLQLLKITFVKKSLTEVTVLSKPEI